MDYVVLVILLALIEYLVLVALVGRARARYGVKAPAISGPEAFERTFRVQQNTLEGLIVLLPGLWLFARYVDPIMAAWLGLAAVIGRAIYAWGYMAAANKRGLGAVICGVVNGILVIGALVGVLRSVI